MTCPTTSLLYINDTLLGTVTADTTPDGSCQGLLDPSLAYPAARPFLQTLTRDIGRLAVADASQITTAEAGRVHEALVGARGALIERGLELRSMTGQKISTTFLMVADYYPPNCDARLLGTSLPLAVLFVLTDPAGEGIAHSLEASY